MSHIIGSAQNIASWMTEKPTYENFARPMRRESFFTLFDVDRVEREPRRSMKYSNFYTDANLSRPSAFLSDDTKKQVMSYMFLLNLAFLKTFIVLLFIRIKY